MVFIAFTNQFGHILNIFEICFDNIDNISSISQQKLYELFNMIQTLINQPFKETGKIKLDESLGQIQNTLGDTGVVVIDLNLDFYGIEYSESILSEWSHTCEPRLGFFNRNDNFVQLDQEGSLSLFHSLIINNY